MDSQMVGKDRDEDTGQYVKTYPPDDFLAAIEAASGAAGTREIADAVGCSVATAHRQLGELEGEGRVDRRVVGNAFLWMLEGGGNVSNSVSEGPYDRADLTIGDFRPGLLEALFGYDEPEVGKAVELEDGTIVRYEGVHDWGRERVDIVMLAVEISSDIGIAVFSAWLYDRLKDRGTEAASETVPEPVQLPLDDDDEEDLEALLRVLLASEELEE